MATSRGAPPRADDDSDVEIGGCRLIQRIDAHAAHGALAVYLARQPRLGDRLVVVKLIPLHDDVDGDPHQEEARERLLRHARALGQLTHPNILPLYDAGIAHGCFYLVTQYVPDGSLAAALGGTAPRGRLALPARPRFVAVLVLQVAAALQHLHAHGMVHGAVGPASVLLHAQPNGRWRALLADATPPSVAEDVAAPAPPASAAVPADDQAALAALACLLLAGRAPGAAHDTPDMPDAAASAAAPLGDAAALCAANPAVPVAAADAIARALAPDPGERFASVVAFAHAFAGAFDEAWVPAARDEWESPSQPASPAPVRLRPDVPSPEFSQSWGEPRHTQQAPGNIRRGNQVGKPPARHQPARHHPWRRAALSVAGLALLLGALVLALRLPDSGAGPVAVLGQPGGGANDSQQIGVAGGQLTIAQGTAVATASIAAAAPPPTPIGQGDRAILIAQPATITADPGQPFTASFIMLNSGASTWSAADGYSLMCDRERHPDASCSSAVAIGFGPYAIAPGQQVKFTVDLIAPTDPGTYLLWWNLAHTGHLFASPDVALRVLVPLPSPSATPTLTPSATPITSPSVTPSGTPGDTPTATPEPSPTDSPTASPSPSPTSAPSATPAGPPVLGPIPPATLPPLG